MIGLIVAMEMEARIFLNEMREKEEITASGRRYYKGILAGVPVVLTESGIGKVHAAHAAGVLLERFQPKALISTGIAGGLGRTSLFDVVLADFVVQHDMDTTPLGDPPGFIGGLNLVKIPASAAINDILAEGIPGVKRGMIATGDRFVATAEEAKRILASFDALACEMESGAVGQVAAVAGVPFAAIRLISDGGDEGAAVTYQALCEKASATNAEILLTALPKLQKIL